MFVKILHIFLGILGLFSLSACGIRLPEISVKIENLSEENKIRQHFVALYAPEKLPRTLYCKAQGRFIGIFGVKFEQGSFGEPAMRFEISRGFGGFWGALYWQSKDSLQTFLLYRQSKKLVDDQKARNKLRLMKEKRGAIQNLPVELYASIYQNSDMQTFFGSPDSLKAYAYAKRGKRNFLVLERNCGQDFCRLYLDSSDYVIHYFARYRENELREVNHFSRHQWVADLPYPMRVRSSAVLALNYKLIIPNPSAEKYRQSFYNLAEFYHLLRQYRKP